MDTLLQLVTAVCVALAVVSVPGLSTATDADDDPCELYITFVDSWRDPSTTVDADDTDLSKCDGNLKENWFRFMLESESAVIPTTCLQDNTCGTRIPLHVNLEGQEMPVAGGMINASLCGSYNLLDQVLDCCVQRQSIRIKHCQSSDDYYIYYMKPPALCPSAFCAVRNVSSIPQELIYRDGDKPRSFKPTTTPPPTTTPMPTTTPTPTTTTTPSPTTTTTTPPPTTTTTTPPPTTTTTTPLLTTTTTTPPPTSTTTTTTERSTTEAPETTSTETAEADQTFPKVLSALSNVVCFVIEGKFQGKLFERVLSKFVADSDLPVVMKDVHFCGNRTVVDVVAASGDSEDIKAADRLLIAVNNTDLKNYWSQVTNLSVVVDMYSHSGKCGASPCLVGDDPTSTMEEPILQRYQLLLILLILVSTVAVVLTVYLVVRCCIHCCKWRSWNLGEVGPEDKEDVSGKPQLKGSEEGSGVCRQLKREKCDQNPAGKGEGQVEVIAVTAC